MFIGTIVPIMSIRTYYVCQRNSKSSLRTWEIILALLTINYIDEETHSAENSLSQRIQWGPRKLLFVHKDTCGKLCRTFV